MSEYRDRALERRTGAESSLSHWQSILEASIPLKQPSLSDASTLKPTGIIQSTPALDSKDVQLNNVSDNNQSGFIFKSNASESLFNLITKKSSPKRFQSDISINGRITYQYELNRQLPIIHKNLYKVKKALINQDVRNRLLDALKLAESKLNDPVDVKDPEIQLDQTDQEDFDIFQDAGREIVPSKSTNLIMPVFNTVEKSDFDVDLSIPGLDSKITKLISDEANLMQHDFFYEQEYQGEYDFGPSLMNGFEDEDFDKGKGSRKRGQKFNQDQVEGSDKKRREWTRKPNDSQRERPKKTK